ncbi:hypothetical protein, partial [Aeromonas enteropelogenes]|uniref:hypothetical protein n=1 Tax=Aeromonas enteropelogenes TaxID=29489 RepID=UPI003B9FD6FC
MDGFSAVKPNVPTRIDLSPFVRGVGATLTTINTTSSERSECHVASPSGLTAEVTIDDGGLCQYAFTVSNGVSNANAAINVLASSSASPILPTLSQAIMLNSPVTFNLENLLGTDWPSGYSLDVDSLVVQGGSEQGEAVASGNSVTYTPPATPDWNRIVFILKNPEKPNEDALGTLYVTVSSTVNQAPTIDSPKYDYRSQSGQPAPVAAENLVLDLESLIGLGIKDPEGGDWQLVEVQSYSATVSPTDPTSVTNKKFNFMAGTIGDHIVSYIVGDHEGGFTAGLIKVTVTAKERIKDWADITVGDLTFFATPLHSEAAAKGVSADGVWDDGVNLTSTPPGNTIAGMTGPQASAYCNGKRLATKA